MRFGWPSPDAPAPSAPPPANDTHTDNSPSTLDSPDFGDGNTVFNPGGVDRINPDHSIEDLLFGAMGGGGFVLGTSSRALARALAAVGLTRSLGFEAHHIVAVLAKPADPARKTLERLGIDINEAANGVFLPRKQHYILHNLEYYAATNKALAAAKTKNEAEQILRSIADGLSAGTFP